MAFIGPQDRVLETSTTASSGALTLSGAVLGFRPFSAVCAVGDTFHYFIEALDAVGQPTGDYEYGLGAYSATNTLTRTTVLGSSNAGSTVTFTAGTKNIGLGLLSAAMQTGSNANGSWMRHANGVLEQWGTGLAGASGASSANAFPVSFLAGTTPVVGAIHYGADPAVNLIVDGTPSTTSFSLRSNYATGSTVGAMWTARGRWI